MDFTPVLTVIQSFDKRNPLKEVCKEWYYILSQHNLDILGSLNSYPGKTLYEKTKQAIYKEDLILINALYTEYTDFLPFDWRNLYVLAPKSIQKILHSITHYILPEYLRTEKDFLELIHPELREAIRLDNPALLTDAPCALFFYEVEILRHNKKNLVECIFNYYIPDEIGYMPYITNDTMKYLILKNEYFRSICNVTGYHPDMCILAMTIDNSLEYMWNDECFVTSIEVIDYFIDESNILDHIEYMIFEEEHGKYKIETQIYLLLKMKGLHPDWFQYHLDMNIQKPIDLPDDYWKKLTHVSLMAECIATREWDNLSLNDMKNLLDAMNHNNKMYKKLQHRYLSLLDPKSFIIESRRTGGKVKNMDLHWQGYQYTLHRDPTEGNPDKYKPCEYAVRYFKEGSDIVTWRCRKDELWINLIIDPSKIEEEVVKYHIRMITL